MKTTTSVGTVPNLPILPVSNLSAGTAAGSVEQLRDTLNQLLPLLEPDVEPALVFRLPAPERG